MITVSVQNTHIEHVEPSGRARLILNGAEITLPNGAHIYPGFVDTHCHLIGPGMMAERIDLVGVSSRQLCIDRVAKEVARRSPNEWVLGFGWNQQDWTDRSDFDLASLDAVAPHNPVMLYRIDTHAVWVNTAAMQAAGLEAGSTVPGGEVVLDHLGNLTGLLLDDAVKVVEKAMPSPSSEDIARWYRYGVDYCLRFGLTGVHDMTVAPEWLDPLVGLADRGEMKIRCQAFLDGKEERWRVLPKPAVLGRNLDAVGVKYFSDGALGSRGAYLLEPYADAPGQRGIAIMTSEELARAALDPVRAGYAIATHAIGDAANRLVLDAYEVLRSEDREAVLRIEHAQIVHPDDVPRFAALNVIPTIQSIHCTSDAEMAEERLGTERCGYAYGWKNLLDVGRPLLGGSDFPIETGDPIAGLRAFVHREGKRGPWYPEQRVSRETALKSYTEWAGLGVPGDVRCGRLESGFDADLTILSGDPFDDPDATVLMTIVGGEICYRV